MKNSRVIYMVLFLITGTLTNVFCQEKENGEKEDEINYVWIDTIIMQNDEEVRLVSDNVTRITCCMKSPKYSRVSGKAAKWIRKNYDPTYEVSTSPFNSLQNRDLVVTVIEAAKEKSQTDSTIVMVNYPIKCN